jgi:SAM-dependent methyltransferase
MVNREREDGAVSGTVSPSRSAIHAAASWGFQAGAAAYERGRPGYSPETMEILVRELRIGPGRRVVDLAAGTGKLTRQLSSTGATVVAVEPVEAMRSTFANLLPGVPIVAGAAEAMPFGSASVDAVTVGQAFHWFDAPAAAREIGRVLTADGRLGMVWNVRDETVDWVAGLTRLIDPYQGDAPRLRASAWRAAFERGSPFGPLREAHVRYEQSTTPEGIVERFASTSFIAALPEKAHREVRSRVRDLLATHPETRGRDRLSMPHRTDVYWCERRTGGDG